jgi:hypothetical protein
VLHVHHGGRRAGCLTSACSRRLYRFQKEGHCIYAPGYIVKRFTLARAPAGHAAADAQSR